MLEIIEVGVDIIQFDEPHLCVLVDPEVRATFTDPEAEMTHAVDWINEIVEGIGGVRLAVHLCRRNWGRRGWGAAGGYEAILDHVKRLKVEQLMMEFSIPVAGDVAVLKELPETCGIGLGCLDVLGSGTAKCVRYCDAESCTTNAIPDTCNCGGCRPNELCFALEESGVGVCVADTDSAECNCIASPVCSF